MKTEVRIPETQVPLSQLEQIFPKVWKQEIKKISSEIESQEYSNNKRLILLDIEENKLRGYSIHLFKEEDYLPNSFRYIKRD